MILTLLELCAEPELGTLDWARAWRARVALAAMRWVASPGALPVGAAHLLASRLQNARVPNIDADKPIGPGVGNRSPRLMVVGDRELGEVAPVLLMRGLRLAGYDELSIYLASARDDPGGALRAVRGIQVVALGPRSADRARAAGRYPIEVPDPWEWDEDVESWWARAHWLGLNAGPWPIDNPMPFFHAATTPRIVEFDFWTVTAPAAGDVAAPTSAEADQPSPQHEPAPAPGEADDDHLRPEVE